MGITARGAWESVKRHFRELGHDTQTEDFTVVGVGDMSGDVFGNGMLLSRAHPAGRRLRPPAHLPRPEPGRGHLLRRAPPAVRAAALLLGRLRHRADLARAAASTRARAKSIPVNAQVREALGIEPGVTKMTPAELMKAILKAPVDLLWNGGIGTYVKASTESNADVGDKANDAIRVDGEDLRVKVVGEGGNLGLTQLGRIEFAAAAGGRINTDAIDNSAGVDTSDHEVNIKILLNGRGRRRRHDRQAAQQAARRDDRRGRRAGAAQQLRAERRARPTPSPRPPACSTPTSASCAAWCATGTWTGRWSSCPPTGRSASGSAPARA